MYVCMYVGVYDLNFSIWGGFSFEVGMDSEAERPVWFDPQIKTDQYGLTRSH